MTCQENLAFWDGPIGDSTNEAFEEASAHMRGCPHCEEIVLAACRLDAASVDPDNYDDDGNFVGENIAF